MMNFNTFLQRIITVSSPDPDDARRRRNLNILIIGLEAILIVEVIYTASGLQGGDVRGNLLLIAGSIFMLLSTVGIYFMNRYWSGVFSAYLFILLLIAVISVSDAPEQLSDGRSLFVFIIPIVIASFVLQPYTTFIFAIASSAIVSILAISSGRSPNSPAILGYLFIAFISWLSSSGLEQTLHELRVINADLDEIVAVRTRDLAEALTRERIESGRSQAILNSIADGVVVFNADHVAMLANPSLSGLTDTPKDRLTGINLDEFVQVGQLSLPGQTAVRELIQNPENIESGMRIDWGKKTLSVSIARVRDTATEENIGTVAVFRDVTREAELEKMKETFVAVVSHELRTPLNAIMGFTEMLKESVYGPITERQTSITERIMVNTKRLLGMVGDLLDEAQIKAGKLLLTKRPIRTASLLEDLHTTMDKIAADKGLYLTDELDPNMPETIVGDPQRLQQILINLVNNSAKFTERGGIHVRILRHDADHWRLEVADTGSGIPEEEIPYIFETFRQVESSSTRQHGGFGLGLSIVHQLVELLNGKVTVRSELHKGSTFIITLPIESMPRTNDMQNLAFVIEDDEDLAGIFTEALKVSGFEVETIRDGALAQKRIGEASPEIIILDMHLPHVDGPALLTQIHADEHLKDTRIFLATADAQMGEFYRGQVDSVLIKPISFSQLRDLTARYRRK